MDDARISNSLCVENLELYPFVKEVIFSVKSLAVVLAITNKVGPQGRSQWLQHYQKAALLSAEFIKEHF